MSQTKKKLITCDNCGAQYSISEPKCPYCECENKIESARRFNEKLNNKRKEIHRISRWPDNVVRHVTKTLAICVAVTVVLVTIIIIISMKMSAGSQSQTYDTKEKELNELESMYDAGDYSAITGKVRSERLYSGVFAKYSQISDVYYYKELAEQYFTELEEDTYGYESTLKLYIEYALTYGCIAVNNAQSYIDANDNFDNDDVLAQQRDQLLTSFKQQFKLTDEEIEHLLSIEQTEEIGTYAEMIYGRIY